MSRSHRIRITEHVTELVCTEDRLNAHVALLPLLPQARMSEHLAKSLADSGFRLDGPIAWRADGDGIDIAVDTATGSVTMKARAEEELSAQGTAQSGHTDQARERGREEAEADARAAIARSHEALAAKNTERLLRKGRDFKDELARIVHRATGEALKEKARMLGSLESMVEGADGSLTLRVRL